MIKLLLGGSPCTFWSIAQKINRETESSGHGWELFRNYRIARDKFRPDYFIYENNKSISQAIRDAITRELGVEPVMINSARVSAQNRKRLYWVGKRNKDGTYSTVTVPEPRDRGILLRDILESVDTWHEKRYALTATYGGWRESEENANRENRQLIIEPVRIGTIENRAQNADLDSCQYRVYAPDGKSVTLCGNGGGIGAKTGLYIVPTTDRITPPVHEVRDGKVVIRGREYPIRLPDGYYIVRKLTVAECKRLQTVPETFVFPVSNSQSYRMLGNGWTVNVIAHILECMDGIRDEPVDVLSMYDGMACGHIALDKIGAKIERYRATEIDKYAIKTATYNFPDIEEIGDAFAVREDSWAAE